MLLNAYQVQIGGHMIRIGMLCWLDVINQKRCWSHFHLYDNLCSRLLTDINHKQIYGNWRNFLATTQTTVIKNIFKCVSPRGLQDDVFNRLQYLKTIIFTLEVISHTKSALKLI